MVLTPTYPRTMETRRLGWWSLISTLALVAFGGYTRGSNSGFGCADEWPLCEGGALGGLLPTWDYHMIVEWTHRLLAAMVGILAIATAISAWRRHRDRPLIRGSATAAVVVIGLQAWVGRLVVAEHLAADLVTLHLAISMTVVILLTLIVVAVEPLRLEARWEGWRGWSIRVGTAAVGSLGVLLLGSIVHNQYHEGWPLMGDSLVPDLSNPMVAVHYFHRVLAAVLMAYLVYLVLVAARRGVPADQKRLVSVAALLYAVNVGVGAFHVFTFVGSGGLVAAHLGLAGAVASLLVAATAMPILAEPQPAAVQNRGSAPHPADASG